MFFKCVINKHNEDILELNTKSGWQSVENLLLERGISILHTYSSKLHKFFGN